jgi:hypothetical protein
MGGAVERPANQWRTPVKERIFDARGQAQDGDALNIINARRAANTETRAAVGYRPRRAYGRGPLERDVCTLLA